MTPKESGSSNPLHTLDSPTPEGPATLALTQIAPDRPVALREVEVEVTSSDGRRATTILHSPELPPRRDATGQNPNPLPPTVLRAVFAFYFVGSAIPIRLNLDSHACFRALEAILTLLGAGRPLLRKPPTDSAQVLDLPFTEPKLLSDDGHCDRFMAKALRQEAARTRVECWALAC